MRMSIFFSVKFLLILVLLLSIPGEGKSITFEFEDCNTVFHVMFGHFSEQFGPN